MKKKGDLVTLTPNKRCFGIAKGFLVLQRYVLPAPLRIRVATRTRKVLVKDDDVYGDAVNTVARRKSLLQDKLFLAMPCLQ